MVAALRWVVRSSPLQVVHSKPVLVIVEEDKSNRRKKRVKVLAVYPSNAAYFRLRVLPSPSPNNKYPVISG